jgi:ice-binding like protein
MSERQRIRWSLALPLIAVAAIAVLLLSMGAGAAQGAVQSSSQSSSNAVTLATSAAPMIQPKSACGQTMLNLGAAVNYRILAGTTITNTGSTVIKGNIGVSPGSAVTGFPPGNVSGKIHKADTAAGLAQAALVTAYNNGMGRTNCAISESGNLGGKTLTPGLYKSTSSLSISSGDLTLSAKGHPGAVFIFQMASTFSTTSGRAVILAGGAQATHIFWIVGSSATLGTTSVVYGNILAHKSISLAMGAVLHGSALAHLGAVTLAGNHVSNAPVQIASPHAAMPATTMARSFL